MGEDDGIPGIQLKQKIAAPPVTQDISAGTVKDSVTATLDSISAQSQPWRDQINNAAGESTYIDPVSGHTSGLLKQVDPSGADLGAGLVSGDYLRALKGLNSALSAPITSITDILSANKLNAAIQNFTQRNGDTLRDMNSSMAMTQRNLDKLADTARNFSASGAKARSIMDQKRALGNDMMAQIDNAIANNNDPDTAEKLKAMRDDWSNWLSSRDARVNAEQPEVNKLDSMANAFQAQASKDASNFSNAANLSDKLLGASTDPNTAYTQHITNSAQKFAQQVQQMLINSRVGLETNLK